MENINALTENEICHDELYELEDDEYCTPEAKKQIDEYLNSIQQNNEKIDKLFEDIVESSDQNDESNHGAESCPSSDDPLVSEAIKHLSSLDESDEISKLKVKSEFKVGSTDQEDAIYNFPKDAINRDFSKLTNSSFLERLQDLIDIENYYDVRNEYCAIHLELNKRHVTNPNEIRAPRFRTRRIIKYRAYGKGYSSAETLLSNDSQIIDLHWLYVHGRKDADDCAAKNIFNSDEFNYEVASTYVRTHGKAHKKAEWIGIDSDEQWALAVIQTKEVRETWNKLSRKLKSKKSLLQQKARRNHSIRGNEHDWVNIYIAACIEKSIFKNEDIKPSNILPWFQLMTGKLISRQSMNNKLKSVKKHIGKI